MRFALRQLAKNPGFTVIAVITLALGIGVNTTAFAILNRLLLQSLPFREASTPVQVWTSTPRDGRAETSPADNFDEKEPNTVFADIAAHQQQRTSYAERGKAPIQVGVVSRTARRGSGTV